MTTPKVIIFTDLDGTLLDRKTYSFDAAQPALQWIRQKDIPLVLSSSKTRAEIDLYRRRLRNEHPFISENGGGVFVPRDYFSFRIPCDREQDGYLVLDLGTSHPRLIEALAAIRTETGVRIKGFSDFTAEQLASRCGLTPEEAALAKKREYDEPFVVEGGPKEIEVVEKTINKKGLNHVWGGRFHHLLGKNDKGRATEILKQLYENQFFSILTVGIGDSPNDLPMLSAVDRPIYLGGETSILSQTDPPIQNLITTEGTGPEAWNEALLSLMRELKV